MPAPGEAVHLERPVERLDAVTEAAEAGALAGAAPPKPSSETSTIRTWSSRATRIVADVPRAYLSTFVSASETTK